MEQPKVEIKYVDNTETDGYLRIVVNGFIQPSIRVSFDVGNDAVIHEGLVRLLTSVYNKSHQDGVRDTKQKLRDFLNWITGR
jgi:hypothetical protein